MVAVPRNTPGSFEGPVGLEKEILTDFDINISAPEYLFRDHSVNEITLTESLLTPSLYGTITCLDATHTIGQVKNLDELAGANVSIRIEREVNSQFGTPTTMDVQQTLYRLAERKPVTNEYEQYKIFFCDPTLLVNAARRVSKSWKCTAPSAIVQDVLTNCLGAPRLAIEGTQVRRTYFAENIHPFQVVSQQADVAIDKANAPSFLHYMTYEDLGTHRFESLKRMAEAGSVFEFTYFEKGDTYFNYGNPSHIISYEFPCDFDLLSDILNGVDENGVDQNSLYIINPFNGIKSQLGNQDQGCGQGGPRNSEAFTNKSSAAAEPNCEIDVERNRLKRQARLGLLEQDKIALRMTVPWNPLLHAGKVVTANFQNKSFTSDSKQIFDDYGTGDYLIVNLTHQIKAGGFAITVLDCVSETVGAGRTLG